MRFEEFSRLHDARVVKCSERREGERVGRMRSEPLLAGVEQVHGRGFNDRRLHAAQNNGCEHDIQDLKLAVFAVGHVVGLTRVILRRSTA